MRRCSGEAATAAANVLVAHTRDCKISRLRVLVRGHFEIDEPDRLTTASELSITD